MNRTGLLVALGLLPVIVAVAVSLTGDSGNGSGSGGGNPAPPVATCPNQVGAGPIQVSFPFSPEKEDLLVPLIKRFNGSNVQACGRAVRVRGEVVSSGEAEAKIAEGELTPVAWSPASSLWGRLLNHESGQEWVAEQNPSIVRTPLVIAMWEPYARALGWPTRKIGFDEILDLATSGGGWAQFGKPEFGAFKLGHTNPDFSTSGLSAVAAEYYAATGKTDDLASDDVRSEDVRRQIREIEQSVVHYGDTTLFFADQLRAYGPDYAHAVAMEEVTLLDFNRNRGNRPKLVAIYPKGGTFFSDNPFIVLDAPWVKPEQKVAAATFRRWLEERVTPELAAKSFFRPGDPDERPRAPVTPENGVDPDEPKEVLSLPEPAVLAEIQQAWREDSKPANVMVVVDTSGSMRRENRLGQAKQGLEVFLRELNPRDRVGLINFGSKVVRRVPLAPFSQNGARMRAAVRSLKPAGGTALYDATRNAVVGIGRLNDAKRLNAVVVLSDGEDTRSSGTLPRLLKTLRAQSGDQLDAIRVYTIAYGREAEKSTLARIAKASRGMAFEGDPAEIDAVYTSISSFF